MAWIRKTIRIANDNKAPLLSGAVLGSSVYIFVYKLLPWFLMRF